MTAVPLDTEDEIREFVALCLKSRTVAKLAEVMPDWLRGPVESRAPELTELRESAERLEQEAALARRAYAKALHAWIAKP
ncbi:hypothetical protein [Streptomyces sp. NPDC127040]|uniref:hypothetical protein n=1 Tax=Streptomyces sp. NPDC127040 TaxID=3347116 RepID=UPI0036480E21